MARPTGRSLFQRLTDRMRGSGAGTEDRNIVGDAGPYDTAPGREQPEGFAARDLAADDERPEGT